MTADFKKYPVRGIDVSKWQAATPDLKGKAFLVARASIGTTRDELYATHVANARAAGILVGAYHFNWSSAVSPEEQARFFLRVAGEVDFLFLDVEGDHKFSASEAKRFIDEVHKAGKKIGLYMSASVFRDSGQDYDWVAKWSSTPPRAWDFWQYGSDPDYTKTIDGNVFKGTLEELQKMSALYVEPTPEEPLVESFNVLEDVLVLAKLPTGTTLYRDTGLVHPAVVLVAPLEARYIGQHSTEPDIRSVAYEPATDPGTSSPVYFVPREAITEFVRVPLLTQAQVDERLSAIKAKFAGLAAEVAALANDVADD